MEDKMDKYRIGRDVQELSSRIERLENAFLSDRERSDADRRSDWSGSISGDLEASVDFEKDPVLWELKEGADFPPFLFTLFHLPPNTQFDVAPQSKTWTCVPEPLIIDVNWDAGGRDEHLRFSDQVFSIIRVTDPNTGIVTAKAIYSATLTARNGRSIDWAGGYIGPPYVPGYYAGPSFHVTLRSAGGAGLFKYYDQFSVFCGANYTVWFESDFPPGLYDLVTGATWEMGSWRVARC
jgi:hypothetical protein